MHRCSWVNDDPLYIDYHDHEWGKPVYDDQKLYEMFLLLLSANLAALIQSLFNLPLS